MLPLSIGYRTDGFGCLNVFRNFPKHFWAVEFHESNIKYFQWVTKNNSFAMLLPGGDTPILGHIRDVWSEWVSFPGQKPADGCKFLTKILQMGHNFDIILPGNGWFSSKLNKTYCSLVNFCCK